MSLKPLPSSTVKLLGSAQVITSASTAVKELVENSLDAGSDCIEVKIENSGLDRLEVRDNGSGISSEDVLFMCQQSYTSKISDFSDLDKLNSFGFRGEALSSLCAVGQVTVTTVTADDKVAKSYKMDSLGKVVSSTLSHITKGTIIVVENLFRNLPVRRQLMSSKKKKSDELKKIEAVIKCVGIIHPGVRLTLAHNKFCIWQKHKVVTLRQSLVQAIPPTMVNQLYDVSYEDEETKLHMMIPRKDCNVHALCYGNLAETFYLFINKRPVRDKLIDKAVQESMFQYFGHYIPAGKLPMCLVSIELPSHALDVNLEPNKTKVIIKDMDGLLKKLKDLFLSHYVGELDPCQQSDNVDADLVKPGSKRKIADEPSNEVTSKSKNEVIKTKLPKMEEIPETNENNFSPEKIIACTQSSNSSVIQNSQEICSKSTSSDFSADGLHFSIERSSLNSGTENSEREENVLKFLEGLPVSAIFEDSFSEEESDPVSLSDTSQKFQASDSQDFNQQKSEENNFSTGKDNLQELGTKISSSDNQPSSEDSSFSFAKSNEQNTTSLKSLDNGTGIHSILFKHNVNHSTDLSSSPNESKEDTGILNTDDITLSQWSKGVVTIKGETVKGPSKILGGPNSLNNENVLERSVSSQMGCKEMSGFTKFAREMRSQIIRQTPGISFTKVASELASQWKNLQEDEKEKYNNMAKGEKNKRMNDKQFQEEKSKLNLPKLQLIKEEKPSDGRKALKKREYCKNISLDISLDKLKTSLIRRLKSKQISDASVIGKLSKDIVCCKSGCDIYALSLPRLKESLLFFDNLANMTIPLKVLEESIVLKEDELGYLLWNTLNCLETSVDINSGTIVVSDERITKNGFRIEVIDAPDGRNFQITDVPKHIAYYGIEDLKEILEVIENNVLLCNLESCRPLKAVSFIRSETIRLMDQVESQDEQVNVSNIINYWFTNVKTSSKTCPHHNEVVKVIHTV